MKYILPVVIILFLCTSAEAFERGSGYNEGDLLMKGHQICGDQSTGIHFDPDCDNSDEATLNTNGTLQLGNIVYPATDGNANEVLKTDGAGTIGWVAQSSGEANLLTYYDSNTLQPLTVSDDLSVHSVNINAVSNTELQYLDGVTSAIQTQLDAKAMKLTYLDSDTLQPLTKSDDLSVHSINVNAVSNTEFQYLDGVSSDIQTQLNARYEANDNISVGTIAASGLATINNNLTVRGDLTVSENLMAVTYGSDGSVTDAELLFLDATSSIQTQLNAKGTTTLTDEASLYSTLSDVTQFYESGDKVGDADTLDTHDSTYFQTDLTNEASLYSALSDVTEFLETSDAATLTSLDTGEGANELFDMDQNVKTTNSVVFNDLSVGTDLTVNNNVKINNDLSVDNDLYVANNIYMTDNGSAGEIESVYGDTLVCDDNLSINGTAKTLGDTDVGGELTVNGVQMNEDVWELNVLSPSDVSTDLSQNSTYIGTNIKGVTVTITEIKLHAVGYDDTACTIKEHTSTTEPLEDMTTVDAINCTTGSGIYYDTETTITHATIENGHEVWITLDTTDDPSSLAGYIKYEW